MKQVKKPAVLQDTNYFSDSEHHLSTGSYSGGGGGGGGSGSGARRIRNRHMSGLDAALAAVSGGGGPPLPGMTKDRRKF